MERLEFQRFSKNFVKLSKLSWIYGFFSLTLPTNSFSMEKKYIIDTDFLPQELTHYHGGYLDEMTDDLYQIVYGICQPSQSLSGVYDLIVRTATRQKSPAIRKFKLLTWKKSLDAIHKTLTKLDTKGFEVIVFIPLICCEMPLSAAKSYFELAIFAINELLESGSVPEPIFPNEPLVPNIKKLFEGSYSEIFTMLDDYDPEIHEMGAGDGVYYQHAKYWQAIIFDEMYRRGIGTVTLGEEETPISPSQYYGNPNLYKEIALEKSLMLELDVESPIPEAPETPSASDNDSIQTRAAVMYFMLSSFCRVTDENFNRAVAMIDYAVGRQTPKYNVNLTNDKKINLENNKNSIKKYIRNCRDEKDYLELPTSDKVRARLTEQGFEISSSDSTKGGRF